MRLRIFLAFTLIVVVTLAAVAFFVQQNTENELQAFLSRGGYIGANDLVVELESYFQEQGNWDGVDQIFETAHSGESGESDRGQGSGRGSGQSYSGIISVLRLADDQYNLVYVPEIFDIEVPVSTEEIERSIELFADDQVVGYLIPPSNTAIPNQNFELNLLERITEALGQAAIIAASLAILLALLLAYIIIRPIQKLTNAAVNMSAGDLSQRVNLKGKDEIATLGKAFNKMASSLEQIEQGRRSMAADIAHELRTPLAVMQVNIEALQDGVYDLNVDSLTPLDKQVKLLARLVEDLRILSLADVGQLPLEFRQTNLGDLLTGLVARFQPVAQKNNKSIQTDFTANCPDVIVDPERIEQIVINLLQNALRYTPEDQSVFVKLERKEKYILISLRDTGPGIPEDALPYIFDRFYRVDQARDRQKGGTGLGLAIAKHIALAHQGKLTAANHEDGGAIFILSLPI